jgi:hypothetical protein
MTDGQATKNAEPGWRRIDSAELAIAERERALARFSVIRRSSDPADDMGEWIIDELDG